MKRWLQRIGVAAGVFALCAAGLSALLQSNWVKEKLRARIVAEVDAATGGQTSLRSVDFDLLHLRATAGGFVLRGKEKPEQAPLFSAERIDAAVQVLSWFSRDIRLTRLAVFKPQVHIYVAADGSTNLPDSKEPRREGTVIEDLIRLKAGHLEVKDGLFEFDKRSQPFSLVAQDVDLSLAYDRRAPGYKTALAAGAIQLPGGLRPAVLLEASLQRDRLLVQRAVARLGESRLEWSGSLENWRQPAIRGAYQAAVMLRDIEASPVKEGFATARGEVVYDNQAGIVVTGELHAEQLAYQAKDLQLRGVAATSKFRLTPVRLDLQGLSVSSPYGNWNGAASLEDWRRLRMEGEASRIPLERIQALFTSTPYSWDAEINGPLNFSGDLTTAGLRRGRVEARLSVTPAAGELPLSGDLDAVWSQECGCIDLGASSLATESARLQFRGVLGQRLEVGFFATKLNELEPVIAMLARKDEYKLPVALADGTARIEAIVTGPLDAPEVRGHVALTNAVLQDIRFDAIQGRIDLTPELVRVTDLEVRRETARIAGDVSLGLDRWQLSDAGAIDAHLRLAGGDLAKLLQLLGAPPRAAGGLEGSLEVSGQAGSPAGSARFVLKDAEIVGERLKELKGDLSLDAQGAWRAALQTGATTLAASGQWKHPNGDLRYGSLSAKGSVKGLSLQDWKTFQIPDLLLEATLAGDLEAELELAEGQIELRRIGGQLRAPGVKVGAAQLGAFALKAATRDGSVVLDVSQGLPGGQAELHGTVKMAGDYHAEGTMRVPRLTFGLIRDLAGGSMPEWPVRGFLEMESTWRGPLLDPKKMTAEITVPQLQVRPRQQDLMETQVDSGDLTLRNNGPVVVGISSSALLVRSARFSALETDLQLNGSYSLGARTPWNLDLLGTVNLAVLGSFYKDLLSSGSAQMTASLRGAASDPQLSGKMTVNNASFALKGVAYGVDKVQGTVYFDKNRANLEKLTGVTGGGQFSFSGFAGLTAGELSYRLQMSTRDVRVRYPEGVSTTLDSDLTLTGSAARSVLSGLITIKRTGFTISGDLASTVGNTGNPLPSAAMQNEFLRNLQFDVRVRTAPDAVLLSSYTSDLQTEADLRLRGSPAKPVLLGNIKANQGQVNFFGNRYTISRGEVLFYNTAVVQPLIDLDLETRVRGITVYLNVSGPLSRLNVTYRSEPPLQSSEILALLTVGRAPASTTSSVTTSDSIRSQTVMENSNASNTLLGTALSAGLNSRTERFFGASRIRIDPSATGVDNLPQARLSIEQSISRDITLTYITNLSASQQQIVRLEWDLSRQWSVIAIKDENGAFAVDFLFRRRLK